MPEDILTNLSSGYYILKYDDDYPLCIVFVDASAEDFMGVPHLAFGAENGGGFHPVSDLPAEAKLIPAKITIASDSGPTTKTELSLLDLGSMERSRKF